MSHGHASVLSNLMEGVFSTAMQNLHVYKNIIDPLLQEGQRNTPCLIALLLS